MKLRFTARAIANLIEIADTIHTHNPAASRRVRAAIYDSLQNLILFPHVGRKQKVPIELAEYASAIPHGVRKFVTRKYAYLVYYRVDEAAEEIVILSVKHPARGPELEDA